MKRVLIWGVLVMSLSAWQVVNAQIKIDGLFFDWDPTTQKDVAPNAEEKIFSEGDPDTPDPARPTYFADLDIEDVFATDDADFVYFRIKMNPIANITNVPNDTSYHGGAAIAVYISVDPGPNDVTGLTWDWWGSGYDFLVQVFPSDSLAETMTAYEQYVFEHTQSGTGWDFVPADTLIGAKVAWNATNNEVEFAVPKLVLFNPHFMPNFAIPDTISFMVYAGENWGPWRADYASNPGVAGFKIGMKKPGPIAVDGLFFDWTPDMQLDVSPNVEENTFADGDPDTPDPANTSYFADLDVEDVFATDDDEFVFVRIKMNSIANLANVINDTSYHGGAAIAAYISVDPGPADVTGLTWDWWGSGYDFFVQVYPPDPGFQAVSGYPQAVWEHKQSGTGWDFSVTDSLRGAWVAWNSLNNDVEMAIPKVMLFNPVYLTNFQMPEKIAIMIYAGENWGPWRADYASQPGVAGYLLTLGGTTDVEEKPTSHAPLAFQLRQNHPNPFNPVTNITFVLPTQQRVSIRVFDLLGKEIATIANRAFAAGEHTVKFDGRTIPSGVYFYVLESGSQHQVRKMALIK